LGSCTYISSVDSFLDYQEDKLIRRAVERELEIIGEAMNRILKINPDIAISNARAIVTTRNKIIHGYDEVDDAVVYTVATKYLVKRTK
jgi:uncharacterized protein with HEPN domain